MPLVCTYYSSNARDVVFSYIPIEIELLTPGIGVPSAEKRL